MNKWRKSSFYGLRRKENGYDFFSLLHREQKATENDANAIDMKTKRGNKTYENNSMAETIAYVYGHSDFWAVVMKCLQHDWR